MKASLNDIDFEIKIFVGGAHLLKRFGKTIDAIKSDGFTNISTIAYLKEDDDTSSDFAHSYYRAVKQFVYVLDDNQPDFVFILGDRWEMLALATSASLLGIPIAHHSGGDVTQGSSDNQIRFSITSLAHLHFVSLPIHKRRLLKMGEENWRIFVTGEPALCNNKNIKIDGEKLLKKLDIKIDENFVLATYHPTTYEKYNFEDQVALFIAGLDYIKETIILTIPNPDPGCELIISKLIKYAEKKTNVKIIKNLGSTLFNAAMDRASLMIGNSSSGLLEAPSFKLPVINVGPRQDGRLKLSNVIDVPLDINQIKAAINMIATDSYKKSLQDISNPYVLDDTIEKILSGLKINKNKSELLSKTYVDRIN